MFDDDNSKDLGRRSMAFLQNSIVSVDRKNCDNSFKLKRVDYNKYYQ